MASFAMQIVSFVLHLLQPIVQHFIDNVQFTLVGWTWLTVCVSMQGAVCVFTVHTAVLG